MTSGKGSVGTLVVGVVVAAIITGLIAMEFLFRLRCFIGPMIETQASEKRELRLNNSSLNSMLLSGSIALVSNMQTFLNSDEICTKYK
jgi:hypothetical protein